MSQFSCIELKDLEQKSHEFTKEWNLKKKQIEKIQNTKFELENAKNELTLAKRNGDWEKAGELSYQIIPSLVQTLEISNKKNKIDEKNFIENTILKLIFIVWIHCFSNKMSKF